jgi:hypothetical protein
MHWEDGMVGETQLKRSRDSCLAVDTGVIGSSCMNLRDPTNLVDSDKIALLSSNHALMGYYLVSETKLMPYACRLLPVTRD